MASYDTPVSDFTGPYSLTFVRDNGPTTPWDYATLQTTPDGGLSAQALLDFIDDVTSNTAWQFTGGLRAYGTTEQILP